MKEKKLKEYMEKNLAGYQTKLLQVGNPTASHVPAFQALRAQVSLKCPLKVARLKRNTPSKFISCFPMKVYAALQMLW